MQNLQITHAEFAIFGAEFRRHYFRLCLRYGRLCRRFWQQIGNNLNVVSLLRSTLSRTWSTLLKVSDFYLPNVACPFDFVAGVYGTKATRSTFIKVDRVEFDFVASVYQAYQSRCSNI